MKRLLCKLVFHRLVVVKKFPTPAGSKKLCCLRCGRFFGMCDSVRAFVPWDSELENMYRSWGML